MRLTLSWFVLFEKVSTEELNIFENTCRRYLSGVILNDHNALVGRVVRDYNWLQECSVSLGRRREISRSMESAASFISTYPPLYLRLTVPEELRAAARETRTSATDKKDNERWSREHVQPERMCHKWRTYPVNSTHMLWVPGRLLFNYRKMPKYLKRKKRSEYLLKEDSIWSRWKDEKKRDKTGKKRVFIGNKEKHVFYTIFPLFFSNS